MTVMIVILTLLVSSVSQQGGKAAPASGDLLERMGQKCPSPTQIYT